MLREAFLGTRRFDDFTNRAGLGEAAIAVRLKELTADGLLERVPYQASGQRTRYEYRLTRKGRDLHPVLTALREWGDIWASDADGPPLHVVHRGCEASVNTRLLCDDGHIVAPDQLEIHEGPGLIST